MPSGRVMKRPTSVTVCVSIFEIVPCAEFDAHRYDHSGSSPPPLPSPLLHGISGVSGIAPTSQCTPSPPSLLVCAAPVVSAVPLIVPAVLLAPPLVSATPVSSAVTGDVVLSDPPVPPSSALPAGVFDPPHAAPTIATIASLSKFVRIAPLPCRSTRSHAAISRATLPACWNARARTRSSDRVDDREPPAVLAQLGVLRPESVVIPAIDLDLAAAGLLPHRRVLHHATLHVVVEDREPPAVLPQLVVLRTVVGVVLSVDLDLAAAGLLPHRRVLGLATLDVVVEDREPPAVLPQLVVLRTVVGVLPTVDLDLAAATLAEHRGVLHGAVDDVVVEDVQTPAV